MSDPSAFEELPELLLSLRSIGSRRRESQESQAFADQDRFFAPLIDSRRAAAQAVSRLQIVAAFDARRLTALIDATIRAFAAERFTTRAPARRAFEAELFEIVEPLREALQRLGVLVEPLPAAHVTAIRDEQWALWLAQIRVVFQAADASWPVLREVLGEPPHAAPRTPRWPFSGRGGQR